ncbi:MAG: VOC family protein [Proteobacteria bacterium]|nr:VOC family protein [Pseudomonadota bacterium]
MIGYVTLGTNDMDRAAAFYDVLMTEFGCKRAWETDRFIAWSADEKGQLLLVIKPFNGEPATVGNGTMVSLAATSKAQVERVHALALELGGKDEGAVGPRGDNFYAGYFRDLDGHKLAVYFMG